MKRIVDGVTYNTDTSTALAMSKWGDEDSSEGVTKGVLYQTRGGAFFVHEERIRKVWNSREEQHEERSDHTFVPYNAEKAQEWIVTGEVEILHNPFGDPPEAEDEAEPSATLYVRMPQSLKKRIDDAARAANVSSNVFAMRCLEGCVKPVVDVKAMIG